MGNFNKTHDDKRSVVILPPDRYDEWLQTGAGKSGDFLRARPSELMSADTPQQGLNL